MIKKANKFFSVSMVKNEIDIIEIFIRYHTSLFDGMVILDNGSSDGTMEVILKLIQEGLPVYLMYNDNPAYNQAEITTKIFYDTIAKFNPDFILPLDVDEFLTSYSNKNVKEYISNKLSKNTFNYLEWVIYVPTKNDNFSEINVLKRLTFRRITQYNCDKKIIIPTLIAKKYKLKIKQGNHDIEGIKGIKFIKNKVPALSLAHYPIRSINQTKSKYLVGWLANLARPNQVLFDWLYYYNIIKSGKELTIENIKTMALNYGIVDKNKKIKTLKDPINLSFFQNIHLKYTNNKLNYTNNILNYAEILARRYSSILNLISSKDKKLILKHFRKEELILQKIKNFMSIEGWLNIKEACELYKIIDSLKGKKLIICEIGSWLGRSSYVLAKAIKNKKSSILYCIDPFNGTGDKYSSIIYKHDQNKLVNPLLVEFKNNMESMGVSKVIKVIQGYSSNVINKFNKKIDLLFIDGNHNYDSVLKDFLLWLKLIKKGGYIVFHDVGASHTTGPKQVVEQKIVNDPMWGEQKLMESLYIAKKIK